MLVTIVNNSTELYYQIMQNDEHHAVITSIGHFKQVMTRRCDKQASPRKEKGVFVNDIVIGSVNDAFAYPTGITQKNYKSFLNGKLVRRVVQ